MAEEQQEEEEEVVEEEKEENPYEKEREKRIMQNKAVLEALQVRSSLSKRLQSLLCMRSAPYLMTPTANRKGVAVNQHSACMPP